MKNPLLIIIILLSICLLGHSQCPEKPVLTWSNWSSSEPLQDTVTICENDATYITAKSPDSPAGTKIIWSGARPSGEQSIPSTIPVVPISGTRTYTAVATYNGCESESANLTIVTVPGTLLTISAEKKDYFVGEQITINSQVENIPSNYFTWHLNGKETYYTDSPQLSFIIDSTIENLEISTTWFEPHCWNISSNTISINVIEANNQQFKVTAIANQTEPQIGEEITLSAQVQNGSGDYTYTWYAASNPNFRVKKTSIGSGASITFTQTTIDDYYVQVTDNETGIEGYSNYVFNKEVIASTSSAPSSLSTTVFPTLTSGLLNIESNGTYAITVYNATGEAVFSQQGQNAEQLDLSQLPNGSYFVQITQNNETTTEKIIIQK